MFQYSNKSLFSGSSELVKIFLLAVLLTLAFAIHDIALQAMLFIAIFCLLLIAGFRDFFRLIFGLLPFLLIADLGFWFFLQDTSIDLANLIIVSNIRIFNLFMATAFFTFSTDAFALVKLFKRAHLPEIVFLPIFVLFRFLPEIEKDLGEIRDIQKIRGITKKNPWSFVKSIMVPLFLTVLQKSDELAVAYYLRKKSGREF